MKQLVFGAINMHTGVLSVGPSLVGVLQSVLEDGTTTVSWMYKTELTFESIEKHPSVARHLKMQERFAATHKLSA